MDVNCSEVKQKQTHATHISLSPYTLEAYFELSASCYHIISTKATRVALQFPDELLSYAPLIAKRITALTGAQTFILADTSYGSCCVDEVASQHVNADFMVHYGKSCHSVTNRLPVYYVYGKQEVNMLAFEDFCGECLGGGGTVMLHYSAVYHHLASKMVAVLEKLGCSVLLPPMIKFQKNSVIEKDPVVKCGDCSCSNETVSKPVFDENEKKNTTIGINISSSSNDNVPKSSNTPVEEHIILYIGEESPNLSHILMVHSQNAIYSFNPTTRTGRLESASVNKILTKRYAKIHKAIQSNVIGIVVGTLGVSSYRDVIDGLKRLISEKGKKSYLLAVGKPNPSKLGNFGEVDVFVFVGCPESTVTLSNESKEYMKPIITPFELVVALTALMQSEYGDFEETEMGWAPGASGVLGKYIMDFGSIATQLKVELTKSRLNANGGSQALTVNSAKEVSQYVSAVDFLSYRTFQGLDIQIAITQPSTLEVGRSGLARDYSELSISTNIHEHEQ